MSTFQEKKKKLKHLIENQIIPLIGKKCILLDAPYHINTGDLLIWLGTIHLLKEHNINLLYTRSADTFHFENIPNDVTILLQGGGKFGDLWRYFQEFKLKVVKQYPHNRIIFLPQTIYYSDSQVLNEDLNIISTHNDIHLCARDRKSYDILSQYLKQNIYLLPDMAFCISETFINKKKRKQSKTINKDLFISRADKEAKKLPKIEFTRPTDIHDWPSMEKMPRNYKCLNTIRFFNAKYNHLMNRLGIIGKYCKYKTTWTEDFFMRYVCLPSIINDAIQFVNSYNYIYTTRLHIAILATLLEKPCTFIDNNYGKNSGFYQTWLNDIDDIIFIYE